MLKNLAIITLLLIFITGCAKRYPMGLSEDDWNQLTPKKKTELLIKQSEINEKRRQERLKKWEAEQKLAMQKQKAEEARLDKIYKEAKYGDIINVNIYKGYYEYFDEYMPVLPTAFTIAKGETKKIEIIAKNKRNSTYEKNLWVTFSKMGNQLTIQTDEPKSYNKHKGIIILNNGKWHYERKYKKSYLDGYRKIKDFSIGIRYADHTRILTKKVDVFNHYDR